MLTQGNFSSLKLIIHNKVMLKEPLELPSVFKERNLHFVFLNNKRKVREYEN